MAKLFIVAVNRKQIGDLMIEQMCSKGRSVLESPQSC